MNSQWRRGLAGLLVALLVGVISGHVRLRNPATNNPLYWANPSVPVVIQLNGSDDVGDLTDDSAIRLALQDWSGIEGSALVLVENTDPTERARTDWQSKNLHTILFDEDGSTGYFQGGGIVAVTSITYTNAGKITDADVLFNGRDYNFSTSGTPGAFDVQAIAAHELGHVAGLDHSGWAGSALYPYVETNDFVARGLSRDEEGAARAAYPAQTFGSISGSVSRSSDASLVAGAHVVALDEEGRPVASVLADTFGNFTVPGLDAGRYLLEVLPFAGVVSEINLSSGQDIDSDFSALVNVGPIDVLEGADASTGALFVEASSALSLGTPTDLLPLRLLPGGTAGATLLGSGLVEGSLLFASDPDLAVEDVTWSGGSVSFRVAVPVGEPFGQVNLVVKAPSGEVSVLTAALEITPANPAVASAQPSAASASGGTPLILNGSGFREGCRVLIGNCIYREGLSGGCQLLDDGTLALTLRATEAGTYDVVVIDRSGVEGRLLDGLLLDQRPVIATVFPRAGQSAGGTLVHLTGSGFGAGTRVILGGAEQAGVQVLDQGRLLFTTGPGATGTQTLDVLDATGAGAQTTYDFTASVDPTLLVVDPG
ncbi:MAG: hypothetical protein ACI9K5_003648, partial [Gammaproteobacteria bacterium]